MTPTSEYLRKTPRTLQEACRDFRTAHPERTLAKCDTCPNGELCEISEQLEFERRKLAAMIEAELADKPATAAAIKRQ